MRRWLAFMLVWGLGTAATIGACWLGLSSVVDAAVPPRTAPFSAAELGRVSPSPTADPGAPVADTVVANQATPVTPSPAPTTAPAAPTPANPPSAAVVAQLSAWEAVPNGRGGTAYRRTFHLQAGDVTFWCDVYDVHVIDARLRPGYALVPTRYDFNSLLVSIISSERASRVYVSWRGGPYAEVTETVT